MKLRLNKSQRSAALSSKVVFSLEAQVDLTVQEQDFVKKYKMGKEVLYSKERVRPELQDYKSAKGFMRNLSAIALNLKINVNNLVDGRTIECKDISEMVDVEETIKTACQGLKTLLDACSGFEGEEIIDY